MTTRKFCDGCDKELPGSTDRGSHNRIRRSRYISDRYHNIEVDVHVAVAGRWNGGNVCADCVVRTVTEGTDVRR